MHIDYIIENIKKYSNNTALVSKNIEVKYCDILEKYYEWNNKIEVIPNNSIVAVSGEFDENSIALMLALLNKSIIYVPIALTVKNIDRYLEISEAEFYINLNDDEKIVNCNRNPVHEILVELKSNNKPGLILFSSGTTGEPKAAVHNLEPMLEKYKKTGKKIKSIAFLLFDHIGGFNTVMYNINNGGLLVTLEERSIDEVCSAIAKYKIELLPTTPSFINMILFSKANDNYDLSSLKIISYGTEPMPESTLKAIHLILPNVKLKQTYGLSEVGIMRTKSESSESLWLKVGGDDDHQIKIVNNILWIKSKMSMIGYLNAESPFDHEGWLNTKDKVLEKDGYIKILGRESELINVGGEKVYPAEVESVILELDFVLDCIVSSEENSILGKVVVCTVLVDSIDKKIAKKEIKLFCNKKLEKFKRPVKIYFNDKTFNSSRFKRKR